MLKDLFELFEKWAQAYGLPETTTNTVLIYGLPLLALLIVSLSLFKLIRYLFKLRNEKKLNRNLSPYYSPADVYRATKYYIPTNYQNVSPSEDDEPGRHYIASAKNRLIPLFINQVFDNHNGDNKFYLVLADSGMGKTTFLINLFIRYKNKIQLPWAPKKKNIFLLPLGAPNVLDEIAKISDHQNTILLLDAFDEDLEAIQDYRSRMSKILNAVWKFSSIVITCRTQFFPSQKEEPYETGYFSFGESGEYKFQKVYVSVFDNRDIKKYLQKKFNWYDIVKYIKAMQIVKKCPNLMVRPMLLSHIDDLVSSNRPFLHSFEIYKVLIDRWIDREAKKPGIKEKYGVENYKKMLLGFSTSLAYNLFINRGIRGGYFIHKDEDLEFGGLHLSDIENEYQDLINIDKKSKSL